jgi:outer membrane lipoprotein-sorting protein
MITRALTIALVVAFPALATASPKPEEVLASANAIVAPAAYKATIGMTAHRKDGTTKTYQFKTAKQGSDKLRLTFDAPKTLAGHEILRLGDELWRYVPSLKRSMRIASRDDFEAGDFRNADVLRVDIVRDYKVTSMKEDGDKYVLDLSASTKQAGYDRVVYTVRKADSMPLQQEFYASSGKKLRTLTFTNPTAFGKHTRPSDVKMVNELAKGQYTEMKVSSFEVVDSIPDKTFRKESLGR